MEAAYLPTAHSESRHVERPHGLVADEWQAHRASLPLLDVSPRAQPALCSQQVQPKGWNEPAAGLFRAAQQRPRAELLLGRFLPKLGGASCAAFLFRPVGLRQGL